MAENFDHERDAKNWLLLWYLMKVASGYKWVSQSVTLSIDTLLEGFHYDKYVYYRKKWFSKTINKNIKMKAKWFQHWEKL